MYIEDALLQVMIPNVFMSPSSMDSLPNISDCKTADAPPMAGQRQCDENLFTLETVIFTKERT